MKANNSRPPHAPSALLQALLAPVFTSAPQSLPSSHEMLLSTHHGSTPSYVSTPPPSPSFITKPVPDFDALPASGFVRLHYVLLLFACSRATVWRWVKSGKLPAPKKLSPRVTAWNVGELRAALSAYMKGETA